MNIQKAVYGIGEDSKSNQFGVGSLLRNGEIDIVVSKIPLGFSVKEMIKTPIIQGKSAIGVLNNYFSADITGFSYRW